MQRSLGRIGAMSALTRSAASRRGRRGILFVSPDYSLLRTTNNRAELCTTISYDQSNNFRSLSTIRYQPFSTTTGSENDKRDDNENDKPSLPARFAAVHHGAAYEAAIAGLHGNQLELAKMEGYGKDDAPFDPFAMEDEIDAMLDAAIAQAKQKQEGPLVTDDDKKEEESLPPEHVVETQEDEDEAFEVIDQAGDNFDKNDEEAVLPDIYNNDGSLRRKRSQLATLRAGYPSGGLFAVVAMPGTQYKVTTDDVLIVNMLKPVAKYKVGSIHTLKDEDILLLGSSHYTLVGMPHVKGAQVDVLVEEITKDAKVVVFKSRRRAKSKRKNGFRRDVTMLRILDIRPPEAYSDQYHVPRVEADFEDQGDDDHDVVAAA